MDNVRLLTPATTLDIFKGFSACSGDGSSRSVNTWWHRNFMCPPLSMNRRPWHLQYKDSDAPVQRCTICVGRFWVQIHLGHHSYIPWCSCCCLYTYTRTYVYRTQRSTCLQLLMVMVIVYGFYPLFGSYKYILLACLPTCLRWPLYGILSLSHR